MKRGIEVIVITSDNTGEAKSKWTYEERDGIKFYKLDCPYNNFMGIAKRLKSFLCFLFGSTRKAFSIDCDMILATSTPLTVGFPALMMHWLKRKPYIFEVRDVWPGCPFAMGYFRNPFVRKFLFGFEKLIYREAAAIVPLSTGIDQNIKKRYPNDKSVVIPNISEVNRFSNTKKTTDITVPEGKNMLLYTGTFGNVNGLSYIIKFAAMTLSIEPNIVYYLIGNGKEKSENIRLAEELGVLNKNVFIYDPVRKNDLPYVYSLATVGSSFVIDIPALWDNSANKFFDTLAAHRPIVINYEGWQADTIRINNCGYVLPTNPDKEDAMKFVEYMNNGELLKTQGANAFELAEREYSLEVAMDKYMGILEHIKS